MTFTYAPSAAGISWLALTQTIDQRMQMEQDLLKLSETSTNVQCNMTKASSEQTFQELTASAQGLENSAWANIGGAGAGIVMSGVSLAGALKTMPTSEAQTINQDVGIAAKPTNLLASNEVEMTEMKPIAVPPSTGGTVQVNSANTNTPPQNSNPSSSTPTNTQSGAPSNNETGGKTTQGTATWHNFWTNHGNTLSTALTQTGSATGTMLQADATHKQAIAKSIEVAAQGIAQVMNQQQSMLSSSISGADTFFNNTEGTFTTIIQVSAVRG